MLQYSLNTAKVGVKHQSSMFIKWQRYCKLQMQH